MFNLPPSNSLTTKVLNFSTSPKLGSEAISRKTQRDQASCLPTGKQLVDVGSGFLHQGSWKRSPFGCRKAMPAMVLTSLALHRRVCLGRTNAKTGRIGRDQSARSCQVVRGHYQSSRHRSGSSVQVWGSGNMPKILILEGWWKSFRNSLLQLSYAKMMIVVGLASGQSFPLDLPLEPVLWSRPNRVISKSCQCFWSFFGPWLSEGSYWSSC